MVNIVSRFLFDFVDLLNSHSDNILELVDVEIIFLLAIFGSYFGEDQ
jgi:hypothetical protein